MDEFSFIGSLLAPLATDKAALGLKDDAAVLAVPAGQELVITKDALVEGVHFKGDEPPELIARKALRVNLSDLAAMGAAPLGYFLALMLPQTDEAWLTGFARGLGSDQKEFGITLMGGDTTRTPGPLGISVTALGLLPQGQSLKRSGAKPGDAIYVSGTIGDAALGLNSPDDAFLLQRYRLPEPRIALGLALRGIATACMDISDGLVQDLGHLCAASGVGAEIEWSQVPLSDAARKALAGMENPYETVLAGGDDYELLFTAPIAGERMLKAQGVTRIGQVVQGKGVRVTDNGKDVVLKQIGYRHF